MNPTVHISRDTAPVTTGIAVGSGILLGEEFGRLPAGLGEEGSVHAVARTDGGLSLTAGLGAAQEIDADSLRTAVGAAAREALRWGHDELHWTWRADLPMPPELQARAIVEGVVLGTYRVGQWQRREHLPLQKLVLCGDVPDLPDLTPIITTAQWANECRTLVNAGGNEVTPERLADEARGLAARFPSLTCDVMGPDELAAAGMGAILAVGQGSALPPRMITVHHRPDNAVPGVRLAFVGKAVTFDAGGINLKIVPRLSLEKSDMAGGSAVLCAMGALAEAGIPVEVVGILAACENMPGGNAYRPGDIVTAADGTTIEIVNTDAEGRVALADALIHARTFNPTHIVDIATLTGATIDALGHVYGCIFSNDDRLSQELAAASASSGDRAWPWPLHRYYRAMLRSSFADIRNYPGYRTAQPVFGAMFLQEFVNELPWAHIDICGPSNLEEPGPDYFAVEGGTGFGVRILVDLAERFATHAPANG